MTRTIIQVPDQPWLRQLYDHWQRDPEGIFIIDHETGKEATYTEFLYEVFSHRSRLKGQLSAATLRKLQNPSEEVFIAIIAGAGFHYMVTLFAIYSLGAIVVPMSMLNLPLRINNRSMLTFIQGRKCTLMKPATS